MPYVIQIGASNGDETAYYNGPTAAMKHKLRASGMGGGCANTVFNINAATRIPWALPQMAEQTLQSLRDVGVAATIKYDLPKPLKMLKWLITPPARS